MLKTKIKKNKPVHTWNYRLMDRSTEKEEWIAIHSVYYKNGEVDGYSKEPAPVGGSNLEEIRATLQRMSEALDKPILKYKEDE